LRIKYQDWRKAAQAEKLFQRYFRSAKEALPGAEMHADQLLNFPDEVLTELRIASDESCWRHGVLLV